MVPERGCDNEAGEEGKKECEILLYIWKNTGELRRSVRNDKSTIGRKKIGLSGKGKKGWQVWRDCFRIK